jgi:hypothetical protein
MSNGEGYGYTWDKPGAKRGPGWRNLNIMQDWPKGTFVTVCSDLLTSHQRKCECAWPSWQHGGSLVAER